MQANRDFRDLFAELNALSVEFLVVGAHALAAHGYVRATKDLDVWVRPTSDNAERLIAALERFGAPTHSLTSDDFATPGITFQIGVAPVRIDIITTVDGLAFEPAWERRVSSNYGGEPVSVLSREDLIVNKRASGRPQDLVDVAELERRT
jgi:uncharacterized nucleotidyltransferase DUF6036